MVKRWHKHTNKIYIYPIDIFIFLYKSLGYICCMIKILNRIIECRKAKGLVQKQMADKLGIAQVNYGKIETGKTELTLDRLFKIADILEVSVLELINPDFNPSNFSKELQEENEKLKKQIEEKSLLIELLLKEKENYKESVFATINKYLDHIIYNLNTDMKKALSEKERNDFERQKEHEIRNKREMIKNLIDVGFFTQTFVDNYYKELEERGMLFNK